MRIRRGEVTIFNSEHPGGLSLSEPYLFKEASTEALTAEPVSIAAGSYFVLGDDRQHSNDSRYWGIESLASSMIRPIHFKVGGP